jgi:hypothetical protein
MNNDRLLVIGLLMMVSATPLALKVSWHYVILMFVGMALTFVGGFISFKRRLGGESAPREPVIPE